MSEELEWAMRYMLWSQTDEERRYWAGRVVVLLGKHTANCIRCALDADDHHPTSKERGE